MIGIRTIILIILLTFSFPATGPGTDQPTDKSVQIEREFALFSADWIDKLNRSYASRPDSIEVFPKGAWYIGHYSSVEKDSALWSIKQISHSPLAYIGVLEYLEWTFECAALTQEEALQGPFIPVKGRKVTEIFRYSQNRWLE